MRYMTWMVMILVCWLWLDINTHSARAAVLIGKDGRLWDTSLSWISSFKKNPMLYLILAQFAATAVKRRWNGQTFHESVTTLGQTPDGRFLLQALMGSSYYQGVNDTTLLVQRFMTWYKNSSKKEQNATQTAVDTAIQNNQGGDWGNNPSNVSVSWQTPDEQEDWGYNPLHQF